MDTTDSNSVSNSTHESEKSETDGFGLKCFMKSSKEVSTVPNAKYDLYYNMEHESRGEAVIFNHSNFTIPNLKQRNGTDADKDNLENTLKKLGFHVTVYSDLPTDKLLQEVERYGKMDHSKNDCFVMCILTHGDEGILYSKNSAYQHHSIFSPFSGDRCKTLLGKPKIFFIQACQGDRLDGGLSVRTQVDSGADFTIPTQADFLVVYSTIPGYYSWRNTTKGSWFVQSLCSVLNDFAFDYDLLTLLTLVNQKVALDFESNVPGDKKMDKQKQIPYVTMMLIRLIKFSRKERYV